MKELPSIYFHVLAKDKAKIMDYWLEQNLDCIDYPKDRIHLHFRTNDNNDNTASIIEQWISKQESDPDGWQWGSIRMDDTSVDPTIKQYGVHEWNPDRFKLLGYLREDGVNDAIAEERDFYFVCDVDNFLMPHTLKTLVGYNLPVVAPLLRYAVTDEDSQHLPYANFHFLATQNGYFLDEPGYYRVLNGEIRGLIKCDVVHCTYLIRKDILPRVSYVNNSDDYEYVIFSNELRRLGIPQYLDNQEVYGYLTLTENLPAVQHWMGVLRDVRKAKRTKEASRITR
jgi:hypothetical protein